MWRGDDVTSLHVTNASRVFYDVIGWLTSSAMREETEDEAEVMAEDEALDEQAAGRLGRGLGSVKAEDPTA